MLFWLNFMQHFSVDDTIFLNLQSIVAAKVYRQILQYLGVTLQGSVQ